MEYREITFTRLSPDESRENRHFFEGKVKRAFVQWCAYQGLFDGVLTDDEIVQAKIEGKLPDCLDIHHIVPLSGTKDPAVNEFENLAILYKATHTKINRQIFDPQLKGIKIGESRKILIPVFERVDAKRIMLLRSGRMTKDCELAIPSLSALKEMRNYCR